MNIAEIHDYPELIAALRKRAQERKIPLNDAGVAAVSGLPDRYLSKVLGVAGMKGGQSRRLGMVSLGPVLTVLGVKLLLAEDAEAIAQVEGRLPSSERARSRAIVQIHQRNKLRENGRLGGIRRAAVMRDAKRKRALACERQRRRRAKSNGNPAA